MGWAEVRRVGRGSALLPRQPLSHAKMPPGDTEGLRGAPLSPAGTPGPAMTRISPVAYGNRAPLYSRVVLDEESPCGL